MTPLSRLEDARGGGAASLVFEGSEGAEGRADAVGRERADEEAGAGAARGAAGGARGRREAPGGGAGAAGGGGGAGAAPADAPRRGALGWKRALVSLLLVRGGLRGPSAAGAGATPVQGIAPGAEGGAPQGWACAWGAYIIMGCPAGIMRPSGMRYIIWYP